MEVREKHTHRGVEEMEGMSALTDPVQLVSDFVFCSHWSSWMNTHLIFFCRCSFFYVTQP